MTAGPTTRSWSRSSGRRWRSGSRRCATGCSRLEEHPAPRQLVAALFRDAHTVKGSARMLGARRTSSTLAHRCRGPARRAARRPVRRPPGPRRPAARGRRGHRPVDARRRRHCRSAPTELAALVGRAGPRRSAGEDPVEVRAEPGAPRPRTTTSPTPTSRSRVRPSRARRLGPRARRAGSTTCSTSSARPSSTCAGSSAGLRRRSATLAAEQPRLVRALRHVLLQPRRRRWPPTSPTPCTRSWRSATSCRPPPASCAAASRTPQGRLGPGPRRRDGPGDGPGAPGRRRASPSWCARWPRRRQGRAAGARRRGRRARHPRARRRRRRARATSSPTPSTTAARARPSGVAAGKHARGRGHASRPGGRLDRRHRGLRRRRGHRRGRAARGRAIARGLLACRLDA